MKTLLSPHMPINDAGYQGGIYLFNNDNLNTAAKIEFQINGVVVKTLEYAIKPKHGIDIYTGTFTGIQGKAQVYYTVADNTYVVAYTIAPNGTTTCTPVVTLDGTVKN